MVRRVSLLLLLVLAFSAACSQEERQPILVQADKVTVINMTDTAWSGIEVWMNDHYRIQANQLEPGQRLDIPIGVFIAAYGQHFDPKRQAAFGIEVSAKDARGQAVRLTWGKGRRR
jgi:hypothetical protein